MAAVLQPSPAQALAREDLCRFAAACFYQPSEELAEERLFDSIVAAAQLVDAPLARQAGRLRDAFAAEELEPLLVDYTRLFLGPTQPLARPYGCYWLTGEATLMQGPTLAVQALYREGGFDVDESCMDAPDHIAIELEFLYLLMFRRNRAHEAGDIDELAAVERLQERFLAEHLGAWIGRFGKAVRDGAGTPFYRELGGFAEAVVAMAERLE
ncbi:MAG: molecular chaperone TorD family protein [Burkholderiales bacterium]|nr:molecular chaperone TorD family protein [Burkholderiales bacterium]